MSMRNYQFPDDFLSCQYILNLFKELFALLLSDLFIEEKRFNFCVCRACEKAYISESLRRKYPNLPAKV